MDIAILGIDLGKNSCSVVGLGASGQVILRRRMQRKTIVNLAARFSPCIRWRLAAARIIWGAFLRRKGTHCA
jgi:hypothetical protein